MLIGGPAFCHSLNSSSSSSCSLSLPPVLPLLRTNATFLPSVICSADSLSGPWRTPPQQPVHSRRRPVYTTLIGSALDCPYDLPPLFPYAPALSLLLSFCSPLLLCPPPTVVLVAGQPTPLWIYGAPHLEKGWHCSAEAQAVEI